ncbi:MAG: hypothetical protein ACLRXN_19965 [Bacteroides caccae]
MVEYSALENGIFSPNSVDYNSLMRRRIKKATNPLQPIFEAFSNSLEATKGLYNNIHIELYHIKDKNLFGEKFSFAAFSIVDDGEGFTPDSFLRFEKLYDESKNKNNLGSGRVQYLHFFKNTLIESIYFIEGEKHIRKIELSKEFYNKYGSVIRSIDENITSNNSVANSTRITFFYTLSEEDKVKYDQLTCGELKDAILKRYVNVFCLNRDNLQNIFIDHYINGIFDEKSSSKITIDDIPAIDYEETIPIHYSALSDKGTSVISCSKSEDFVIRSYRLPSNILPRNEVRLTSKGEAFCHQGFNFSLITEAPRIEMGISFLFLISSDYLTSRDSDIRGNLNIISKSDFISKRNLFTGKQEILIDDIENSTISSISTHYPALQKAKDNANENIRKVAEMFSIDASLLEKAGVKCSDSDINVLKKVYTFTADVKAESDAKIKSIVDNLHALDPNDKGFKRKFDQKVKELNEALPLSVRNELSQYLSRRTLVLQLMEQAIKGQLDVQKTEPKTKKKTKSKRQPEGIFHNLLFPKGSSESIESNLWILNEEYIHYHGLSESELDDIKIDGQPLFKQNLTPEELDYKQRTTGDVGIRRPDVLLFPSEGKCIIIEFKAPEVDVSKHLHQIHQYASIIHHLSDERFKFNSFYGYLIGENADIYSIIDSDGDFQQSQSLGYIVRPYKALPRLFGREQGVLYTEVIKFSDLLKRAKLRSKVFTGKILSESIISSKD